MNDGERAFVVVAGPRVENRYRDLADSLLTPHGRVAWVDWLGDAPVEGREELLDIALADADAVVSTPWLGAAPHLEMPRFDERRWECAAAVKAIAGTYDFRFGWIDLEEAERRGVTVVDTSRTMTPTVAEFGLAMTLNLLRGIPESIELVRRGDWTSHAPDGDGFVYGDLAGRRVGLAGYGSINRRYRSFLAPFGCDVATYDPFVDDETLQRDLVGRATSLVELARSSEIFVVAIPPTPATLEVVSADVIDALPTRSLFVLLSRMAVVQQEALWRRLHNDELRAAIDVFSPEPPPPDAWFRRARNVLPTPHIAGNAVYAHQRCFEEACRDAVEILRGGTPRHPATRRDKKLYEGSLDS
jgi:phosphoglycerate dehydrogenase-like enzyme